MALPTYKLAVLAHLNLVADPDIYIRGGFHNNTIPYQTALRNLASLACSEEQTLDGLKISANQMAYFNFRSNCIAFAEAVWKAREQVIADALERAAPAPDCVEFIEDAE